jgi:hypothetical protein
MGETSSEAATLAASIGALNEIETGASRALFAAMDELKDAGLSGTIAAAGGVATVRLGETMPRAPIPINPPMPIAIPNLVAIERRIRTGT